MTKRSLQKVSRRERVGDDVAISPGPFPCAVPDTSFLIEEFRRQFAARPEPIDVSFRNLVPWVKLGDQYTHQLHPYPAKLLPHIANFFVNSSRLSAAGTVLDPFCGSGTVALEASLAGMTPYVADANPMAQLITRVKTTNYDPDVLLHHTVQVLRRAKQFRTAPTIPIVNAALWYTPAIKADLDILMRAIREVEDESVRDFFLLCFSGVARKLSFADPTISVPVRLKPKNSLGAEGCKRVKDRLKWLKSANPYEELSATCLANVERVLRANEAMPERQAAISVGRDARRLESELGGGNLASSSIPLIITSPPYGSAQKYVRAMSLSLNWLELASPKDLSALEGKTIGREHLPGPYTPSTRNFSDDVEAVLHRIHGVNETRERITRSYLCDLSAALEEIRRVTAPGGCVVIVIGNNQVCGELLETDNFIDREMKRLGFQTEFILLDQIKSRGLLTKRNKTAAMISRESVLMFKLPTKRNVSR